MNFAEEKTRKRFFAKFEKEVEELRNCNFKPNINKKQEKVKPQTMERLV